MSSFLILASYLPKTWATLVKDPKNRLEVAIPIVDNLGGKIVCAFLAFGEYDSVAIVDMPDDITAASLSMALSASGAFKSVKTTRLLDWKDAVEAMKKAKKVLFNLPNDAPIFLKRV
ncbi:MAG: GYD domain-containing protein [Candidatus Bathyarchaeota archaeon]